MTSYEEALAIGLRSVGLQPCEAVGLDGLLGRVLAEPIVAPVDLPPFDNAAVDGYGISDSNTAHGRPLRIIGEVAAGDDATVIRLEAGEAIRLFTGSALPRGVETVVMQEDTALEGGKAVVQRPVKAGANIRRKGEEVRRGETVLGSGVVVTPPVLGVIATLGIDKVEVRKWPRVAVVGTGSELTSPGQALRSGHVYESNTYGVQAALHALGIGDVTVFRCRDDRAETRDVLHTALQVADVVITCGGISVGDHDLVRPCLAELGVREEIWRVAIKPGKPYYFGVSPEGRPVFGLPGNPVSALVVFTLFVRPALMKMLGVPQARVQRARLGHSVPEAKGRDEFFRARLDLGTEGSVASRLEAQGSHMLTGLAAADALVRVPADGGPLAEGDIVETIPLTWRLTP